MRGEQPSVLTHIRVPFIILVTSKNDPISTPSGLFQRPHSYSDTFAVPFLSRTSEKSSEYLRHNSRSCKGTLPLGAETLKDRSHSRWSADIGKDATRPSHIGTVYHRLTRHYLVLWPKGKSRACVCDPFVLYSNRYMASVTSNGGALVQANSSRRNRCESIQSAPLPGNDLVLLCFCLSWSLSTPICIDV